MPTAIIFDLGGVLLNIDYQLTSNAFQNLGWANFDVFYSQKNQKKIFDDLEVGKINESEFVDELKQYLPEASNAEIIAAWNAMLLDFPYQRLQLLKELNKHYPLFLYSNTNAIHYKAFEQAIHTHFDGLHLSSLFKKAYYSHILGKRKPHKESFEFILNEQQLNPASTLFIDDSIQHIEGAKEAGLMTYHLKKGEDITQLFPDIIL